jgi:hypothetical protein
MEPDNLRFGGGLAHTVFNPAVLVFVLIAGALICFAPRSKAIVAFLVTSILIPTDQVLVFGALHFPVLRILIIFGFCRLLWAKLSAKSEVFSGGMNRLDWAMIFLAVFTAVNGMLLWRQSAAVIFQLGNLYTAFGLYFLLRFLIRDEEDIQRAIRTLAYAAVVVAGIMVFEQATGRNPLYALLGGAQSTTFATLSERDDRFRATGCFAHPILAGTFGAILLPLFVGLAWKYKKDRRIATMGIVAATIIPIAANSSTSLLGFAGGVFALACWPLRKVMRQLRWAIVIVLVSLHLYMKSPVWHLISDIDLAGGSSSYHRYQLLNQCIIHFWDWLLIGTKDYGNWGWDMFDLSNQYVAVADPSGLLPLVFFLTVIVLGFKYLGKARKAVEGQTRDEFFVWAIGCALFANVVAFFGISYFDQTIVAWYALLAIICCVTLAARSTEKERLSVSAAMPDYVPATPLRLAESGEQMTHAKGSETRDTKIGPFRPEGLASGAGGNV